MSTQTYEEYTRQRKQKLTGPCQIKLCSRVSKRFYMDHCHIHGYIRGVVCPSCNSAMKRIDKIMRAHGSLTFNTRVLNGLTRWANVPPSSYLHHWDRCPGCEFQFSGDQVIGILDAHRATIQKIKRTYYSGSLLKLLRMRWECRRMRHRR